ncbi:hypothetical protein Tco_0537418 [Tanacetum coccineum]
MFKLCWMHDYELLQITGARREELKPLNKELVASIDNKEYTITEASVRSKLQLADATGDISGGYTRNMFPCIVGEKRKVEVQEAAQYYTEEDWDTIKAKLEANAELTKNLQG